MRDAALFEIQKVAPTDEAGVSRYAADRPWCQRVLGNIERMHSMCD